MLASTRRARPPMPSSAVPRRAASRRCRDPAAAPRTGRATSEAALQPPFLLADQGPLAERRGPAGRYAGIPCPSSERCPSGLRSATGNRVRAERCVAGSNPALSASLLAMRSPAVAAGLRHGEGGIRTLEAGIHPPNALAGRRLQPLGHFSGARATG